MTDPEIIQIMTASGPAGAGVLILALLLKQWLGQVKSELVQLKKQVESVEKTLSDANLKAATHQASSVTKLNELERRISTLEARPQTGRPGAN